VRFRIDAGVEHAYARTVNGVTPLSIAAQIGHVEVVRLLADGDW
jgi:ankyrin repeat protein